MSGDELKLGDRVVLQSEQAAAHVGVNVKTWSSWRARGGPKRNPLPEPDRWINNRTPVWYPETLDEWRNGR